MTDWIPTTDDVEVALHDLAGESSDAHPIVLIAHATGFHGRAYLPVAAGLTPRYHTLGFDARGHGDTAAPLDEDEAVDWRHYGEDALAVARHLTGQPGGQGGLVGFGHSKGGAALLMAADQDPDLFRLLILFEPIVYPPPDPSIERPPSPLIDGARRRRPSFASIDEAIANYGSKPPMSTFDPEALEAYVRYGMRDDPDAGGVRLKCEPEREARTFEAGASHDTWARLPGIRVPTVVVAGVIEDDLRPASRAQPIADALPNGRYLHLPELDHFGPMTHPRLIADLIATSIAEEDDTPVVR